MTNKTPISLIQNNFVSQNLEVGLDALANRMAHALAALGVRSGDRVGLWLDKSTAAIGGMHAAMRLGAAYVPLDPLMPAQRVQTILNDCNVRVVISNTARLDDLARADFTASTPMAVDGENWDRVQTLPAEPPYAPPGDPERLAFILYTSGSTGAPKGVCISHNNAQAFVDWATSATGLGSHDRLSNHAPFHFDLSVFDHFGALSAGACVVLLPDMHSYSPTYLIETLVKERISVWYSVPSVLVLMMEKGGLLEDHNLRALSLRVVFFAGECFPIHKLRPLRQALPDVRFFNLYGPTETNVCTAYEVHDIAPDRLTSVPIGGGVSGDRVLGQKAGRRRRVCGRGR